MTEAKSARKRVTAATDFDVMVSNLQFLHSHSASQGVAEILAERRRQIETGRTPVHDTEEHELDGYLARRAAECITSRNLCDKGADHSLAKAGALTAAEIDRRRG
jgi:hypothetical protein